MLLSFLLPAQLLDGEQLKPTLVAEHFGAKLDHLTVYQVVWWDVSHDELQVPRLHKGDHLEMDFDSFLQLLQRELYIIDRWLVRIEALPEPPFFLLALCDEACQVLVSALAE